MTLPQWVDLLSAILGAGGTVALFFGSWSYEPFEGAPFNSEMLSRSNDGVLARNRRRMAIQRLGLALLLLGFIGQAIGALVG